MQNWKSSWIMYSTALPVVKNLCPADGHTKRQEIKELLRELNRQNHGVKERMFTAVLNGRIPDWPTRQDKRFL